MKVRTKLLSVLLIVSLFSPIVAYVALVGNPRISFALRMNESEAEQAVLAQNLRSDLMAIGSAMEESLAESYRIKAEGGDKEDVRRQRTLANSAVLSEVAKYGTDLSTLAKLQKQQVQEGLTAGRGASPDLIEENETQYLKDLADSFPTLKRNAEQFLRLSDKSLPGEDEFVQKTMEPEVRDELSKTVLDLINVNNQGEDQYRRNIETSLKDSYRGSILIVLLGLVAAALLLAAVSRAVIAPIQQLRDAALQLGNGKLDSRIPSHAKDELGELAGSFNLVADNLTKMIAERAEAQDELSEAHEKLKPSMGELESRNREAGALSEMADLLQSCLTLEEASGVITSSAEKLFPGFSGSMLMYSASRNILEAVTSWGGNLPVERVFGPDDCWALRRGRLHQSKSGAGAVRCGHLGAESRQPSVCAPLMAHGETLGILCLVADLNGASGARESISEFNVKLAVSVGEQAALSFANLKLREKLSYQSIRDPLTGLFNRRYLDESLEREVSRAVRKKRSLGVIMLDVDRFKKFNDTFGHDAGDTVLRELGDYLAKFIRRGDLACRYGGEEFMLVLPESSLEDTRRRAEELRSAFQQVSIKHRDIVLGKVTVSLGVAASPEHGITASDLLAAADGALLRAKQEGRDRVLIAEVPSQLA